MRVTLLGAADDPSCYSRLVNDWVCMDYVADRQQQIVDATVQHIGITVVSVVLGLLIAFPLALLARRLPRLESAILGVTTGIYTVPSLALFPLLVPFTGLTATTVVIGLALYALTILVRSLLEGLRSVPDDVRESATGLGYGRGQLLLKVELPLAVPLIVAGLRLASVSTIGLVTITGILGQAYGGLGFFIFERLTFPTEVLAGAIGSILLAIGADVFFSRVQRRLTPWS
jgi:osmoprotectant transport system permease protein